MPVFGLFTLSEPLRTGSLGESAAGGEPGSDQLEGEVCLGLAAEDFLLLKEKVRKRQKKKTSGK